MCQHVGIAWAVAAQSRFRLFRRSKGRHPGHETYEHLVVLLERAVALQEEFQAKPRVLDDRLAVT
eukprot:2120241-Karenia_brevis.AAC.1